MDLFLAWWPVIAAAFTLLATTLAVIHAAMGKQDVKSAIGWVAFIIVSPGIGPILYMLFGVNRIHRRAHTMRGGENSRLGVAEPPEIDGATRIAQRFGAEAQNLVQLARLVDSVDRRPLVPGNRIEVYNDGDDAYEAMLAAIDAARDRVWLSSYIFGADRSGYRFAARLREAVMRGVEVRVLIDAVGNRYSLPSIIPYLRKLGVPVARFLPTLLPWRMPYMNLRNHRKLLIVDDHLAFTGGMNIREGHQPSTSPSTPISDMHFRIEGPVTDQLAGVFARDWRFTTDERFDRRAPTGPLPDGTVFSRAISDGPDEELNLLRWTLLGAITCARSSVRLATPYFLPEDDLINALTTAARRGLQVEIFLPEVNNLRLVQWASSFPVAKVLAGGCRVWATPPPFDHSKLLVIDGVWSLIGSANWDPRSLRLNFEVCLECYDPELAKKLETELDARRNRGTRLIAGQLRRRHFLIRIRDALARLLTPYL